MYVAKISRKNFFLAVKVFEKQWSEELLSNKIILVAQKNFLFRSSADRWINSEIRKNLFIKKKLEIIDD